MSFCFLCEEHDCDPGKHRAEVMIGRKRKVVAQRKGRDEFRTLLQQRILLITILLWQYYEQKKRINK